jgi:predicted nucleotidyltransferase
MGRRSIIEQLRGFKKNVSKDYPLKRMILFGSRATGRSHKDSDIDLILVSEKFKRMNFLKRGARMYDYWDLKRPVDFLCYTPKEFKEKSKNAVIIRQAVKEGVVI